MKDILKIVFVIIGTLIGAGFASGQEIYSFFFTYGLKGIFGIILSSVLIGVVINKILYLSKKRNIKNYKELLNNIIKSEGPKFNIKNVVNVIINIFILITFFIMIAGFGAYFEQELRINSTIGSGILAIICFFVFMTSVKGVIKVNEIVIPILILFLAIIGILNIKDIAIFEINKYVIEINTGNWIVSSILYASYNSILLIPILIRLKNYIRDKKQINKVAIISTAIVTILSLSIYFLLVRVDVDITKLEMPAVYVVSNMFYGLKTIYGFIILLAIFTTCISLGVSFLENVSKTHKMYKLISAVICLFSVLVSNIGFANLISLLYPVFGFAGLLQIIRIVFVKNLEKNRKN